MHTIARACRMLAWAGGLLVAAGAAHAQAPGTATLRIESTPSAAEVELIGGRAGATPLVVTERDIYPNDYPDARADLYGVVLLRHAGCEPLRHRVTLGDIKQGLHLSLACGTATARAPATASQDTRLRTAPPPLAPQETVPQRRLRQLQVLRELLDEGLISPAEEQRIRRRILQSKQP